MIGPLVDPESRAAALRALYARLRFAESCCVIGINDVGKTTLVTLLQQPAVRERFAPDLREPRLFVHVDGNLLAGADESDLYALVTAETVASARRAGARLDPPEPHTGAADPLLAAVALERLLVSLVDQGYWPVIVFDEFAPVYRRLEARAALALRAIENRLGPRVAYVVAVERPLHELRGTSDTAEFEEMFVGGTQHLAPLEREHGATLVRRHAAQRSYALPEGTSERLADLTGGHPGLLLAACAAAQRAGAPPPPDVERLASSQEVRAECQNVWDRLAEDEQRLVLSGGLFIPLLEQFGRAAAPTAATGLVVQLDTGQVTIDGAPPAAPLGATEYRLLRALASRPGSLVTKDEISRAVWPEEQRLGGVDDARIDKLVDRVRAKIEPDPKAPQYLVTVRGLGYRLLTGA